MSETPQETSESNQSPDTTVSNKVSMSIMGESTSKEEMTVSEIGNSVHDSDSSTTITEIPHQTSESNPAPDTTALNKVSDSTISKSTSKAGTTTKTNSGTTIHSTDLATSRATSEITSSTESTKTTENTSQESTKTVSEASQSDTVDNVDYMDSMLSKETTTSNYPNIPDRPHKDYDPQLYIKAQNLTSQMWRHLSNGKKQEFSEYARQLHSILRSKMVDILQVDGDLTTEVLSGIFSTKVNSGEIKPEQVMSLQMFTLAMHQDYVRKTIQVFELTPEDFGSTPTYFCRVNINKYFHIGRVTRDRVERVHTKSKLK